MKLWGEVFITIAKNLGQILLSCLSGFVSSQWVRLPVLWICKILVLPYRLFRRLNPEGRISLVKYAPANGRWLTALIEILFFPYTAYLASVENIGESEHDREALAFWFSFAFVSVLPVIWFLVWLLSDVSS